jgi:hypothetical protein
MIKTTIFQKFFVLIFVFALSIANGQEKKQKTTTLFGKQIKTENINPDNGIIRCASTEYEKFLQESDPKRMTDAQFEAWVNPLIEQYKALQTVSSESGGIITIPVVVHVIHNGQAVGTAPNITDSQVLSQITVMNNDFRRLAGTPGFNTNAVGVDTQIQFALAKQDPNGNPTNGIDRVNLCQASWSTGAIDSTVKPTTIWDPTLYLNMWSVNFTDGSLLGYAQFPNASGLAGLNASGGAANSDGVVANYSTFGSKNYNDGTFILNAPYNEGRTMTHEVGHWIGLRHIWGDGNCSVDDFCADTPNAGAANFGCPTGTNSCTGIGNPGNDMIENYMDYSDDACMNIYTQNQKDRMVVIMNNAARRVTLKTSQKDVAIPLFANDAEVKLEASCAAAGGSCTSGTQATQRVILYNRGTSTLTSASLSYNINGGTNTTYPWTGSLASNKFAVIEMPVVSPVVGTINVSVVNANGVTDQRATNNAASIAFAPAAGPANYTFNNVVFRLQGDRFGTETTWNLKNAAGTTLYFGGPYTDLATNTTQALVASQNWALASNQCYTFNIIDSYGDGICCTYGAGYYDIKNTDGSVIVASSTGSFGAGESKSFSINALGTFEFEALSSLYLYPNPTNGILNISLNGSDLPDSYTIHNYLGQLIAKKSVASSSDLTINTSTYSNGVYLISVEKGNEKKTLRFIKE